jgi:histone deacetylase complex regulatory component SIN3
MNYDNIPIQERSEDLAIEETERIIKILTSIINKLKAKEK